MWKRNNLPITCAKETLLLENPDKPQQKRKLRKFCSNSKNSNVLVIGPSESGKTKHYVNQRVNITECESSFVAVMCKTDIEKHHVELINKGFTVKILDLSFESQSEKYNPFVYCHDEADMLRFIDYIMMSSDHYNSSEYPFFANAEKLLHISVLSYIQLIYKDQPEKQNLSTYCEVINTIAKSISNKNNTAIQLFDDLEKTYPQNPATGAFKKFICSCDNDKIANAICISATEELQYLLPNDKVKHFLSTDTLNLNNTQQKTAFLIIPSMWSDPLCRFISSLFVSQIIDIYSRDLNKNKIRLILDNFQNYRDISNLLQIITAKNITADFIVQSADQLPNEDITNICSNEIYFGLNSKQKNILRRKAMKNQYFNTTPQSNTLVIGCAGSGKTVCYVEQAIKTCTTSFVTIDTADLYEKYKDMLKDKGYTVNVLNLYDLTKSDKYNPFVYCHSESDVVIIAKTLYANISRHDQNNDLFATAEEAVLKAIMLYIYNVYKDQPDKQSLNSVREFIRIAMADADKDDDQNEFHQIFAKFKKDMPESATNICYAAFKRGSKSTQKSVLIGLESKLSFLAISDFRKLAEKNDFALDDIDHDKMAVFIKSNPCDATFRCMAAIMIEQIMYTCCRAKTGNRVRILLDDYSNTMGIIPDMYKFISVPKVSNLNIDIIVQALDQIGNDDDKNLIIANCDKKVILGCITENDAEFVKELTGINPRGLNMNKCIVASKNHDPYITKKIFA